MQLSLRFILALSAMASVFCPVGNARADIVVNIYEQVGNVYVDGAGSINTSALVFDTSNIIIPQRISAFDGEVSFGNDPKDVYDSFGTQLPGFGSSFYQHPDIGVGDSFGIIGATNNIFVPLGYASGDALSASMTYAGATLDSLGLTPGTYVASWGSGVNADSFTVNVLTNAIPEPSCVVLLGLTAGIALLRRRKCQSVC